MQAFTMSTANSGEMLIGRRNNLNSFVNMPNAQSTFFPSGWHDSLALFSSCPDGLHRKGEVRKLYHPKPHTGHLAVQFHSKVSNWEYLINLSLIIFGMRYLWTQSNRRPCHALQYPQNETAHRVRDCQQHGRKIIFVVEIHWAAEFGIYYSDVFPIYCVRTIRNLAFRSNPEAAASQRLAGRFGMKSSCKSAQTFWQTWCTLLFTVDASIL